MPAFLAGMNERGSGSSPGSRRKENLKIKRLKRLKD